MKIGINIDEKKVVTCIYENITDLTESNDLIIIEVADDFIEKRGDKQYKYINNKLVPSTDLLQIHNNKARISELKQLLSDTDYISNKIIEFTALQQINGTDDPIPPDWVEIINERENHRVEINQLETKLNELGE